MIDALVSGDVRGVIEEDAATAKLLGAPPFGARAEVTGEAAAEFAALVGESLRVRRVDDAYVVTAGNVDELTRVLGETPRPGGRMRLEVF